ncbi:MAG: acylphosphatase [Gammaproteobacteria bacterium]|nr:MAG: acylphosphatase [Gammaproteobacteria bacterium]
MQEMNRVCRHYRVWGRVQGVGFRAATCQTARRLGVDGWVRNCPDGSVEVVACAPPAVLAEFEAWLHQGPPLAEVQAVERTALDAPAPAGGFETRA